LKEERIKSAFEIAMEKLSDLPELTPEEIREQKEKEYGPVGEALARKYLSGSISDSELHLELAGYSGDRGLIIRHSLAESLCRELRLENDGEIGGRALKGLKLLLPENSKAVERIGDEFRNIVDEFSKKKEENSRQFEVMAIERLGKLGIAGSAVRPNLNEDAYWKQHLHEIQNVYEPRLEDIRSRLMREFRSAAGSRQSAELP
jgi:hypothetical protein